MGINSEVIPMVNEQGVVGSCGERVFFLASLAELPEQQLPG